MSSTVAVEGGPVLNGDICSKSKSKVFEKVENVSELEPILRERLPIAANIFNICINQSKWSGEVNWYTLDGDISSQSWIMAIYFRDDFGFEISVSRPLNTPITADIREAFSSSSLINWFEPFVFASVDTSISAMISDISVREKGNFTHIHPCNLYYMDIEDAVNLSDEFSHDEGVEVKSIDSTLGEEFILSTWKYSAEGSAQYVKEVLRRNLSTGVYVNGKIVSGVTFVVHGLIGMLYTLTDYRGKGYAQSTMHLIMKRSAQMGLVPCCTVELRNEASKAFQNKIGFKLAGEVDFVVCEKASF